MRFLLAFAICMVGSSIAFGKICIILGVIQSVNGSPSQYSYNAGDEIGILASFEMHGPPISDGSHWEEYDYGWKWYTNGVPDGVTKWPVFLDEGQNVYPIRDEGFYVPGPAPATIEAVVFIDRYYGPGDEEDFAMWID